MKSGANKVDLAKIKQMYQNDHTVEEVSSHLGIDPKCIQSFFEHFEKTKEEADE